MEFNAIEDIPVQYDSSGLIHFGDHSLPIMAEAVPGSAQLQSYWLNMTKTLGDHCSLTPFACMNAYDFVITHVHGLSLRECMEDRVADWWTETDNGWRMSPWLRDFLKELIPRLMTIIKKGIIFKPTVDNVVFDVEDIESTDAEPKFPSVPKFRRLWDDTEGFSPKDTWKVLAKLVKDIIEMTKQHCGDFVVHPDVEHFIQMFPSYCQVATCGKLVKHPALMSTREILDFIVQFRDMSREGKVDTVRLKYNLFSTRTKISEAGADNWEAVVACDPRMKEVLTAWKVDTAAFRGLTKDDDLETHTKPVELSYFIRNVYHHINSEKLKNAYQNVYYYNRLAEDLYKDFPQLATYLYDCYLKGETLSIFT